MDSGELVFLSDDINYLHAINNCEKNYRKFTRYTHDCYKKAAERTLLNSSSIKGVNNLALGSIGVLSTVLLGGYSLCIIANLFGVSSIEDRLIGFFTIPSLAIGGGFTLYTFDELFKEKFLKGTKLSLFLARKSKEYIEELQKIEERLINFPIYDFLKNSKVENKDLFDYYLKACLEDDINLITDHLIIYQKLKLSFYHNLEINMHDKIETSANIRR